MKFRVAASVLVIVISSAFAAKVPSAQIVDAGSFGVFINGRRVATETFKIEQRADGSFAKSEVKVEDGSVQRSEMELTSRGDIVRYAWQQLGQSKAEVSVVPKNDFLSELVSSGPNQKAFTVPHLVPPSTPILEDNFFVHREILIWRYLASGCTPKPEGLKCSTAPQQFGVLIPLQHTSETVTIDFKSKEKIPLKGSEVECNIFRMKTENSEWLVYMDNQEKLVRITADAAGLEVLRD